MYTGHAGHQHMEAGLYQSVSQTIITAGAIVAVIAIVSLLVIYDLRRKEHKANTKSEE